LDWRTRLINLMQSLSVTTGKASATIVLAEDEADLRALYAEILRRNGYTVWEAADGAEAVRLVRAYTPDLLLLDIWMPVLNGLEVLEQIGKAPEAIGVRVVVLSHVGDADTRLEGFALGADDYWTKDITLAELCAGIEQLFRMARTPNESPPDADDEW
jgi:DNA-binding response OmpR family regulator